MEFFAVIGLITVTWFIYNFVTTVLVEPKPKENKSGFVYDFMRDSDNDETPADQESDDDEFFTYNTNDDKLGAPLFELLPVIENPEAIEFNTLLEKISSYARLYNYLKSVYEESVREDVFKKEDNVRLKVYEAELLRREMYFELFGEHYRTFASKETFTEPEQKMLAAATNALRASANSIVRDYNAARKICISECNLSKTAQVDRLYRLHDAEEQHFFDLPKERDRLAKSIEKAMKNVFSGPH